MLDLDKCEELIEEALASTTRDSFRQAVSPLLDEHEILSFGIERSSTHWRARIIEKERFDLLEQIDYPPAHLVTRPGRLNNIGEPYFYVSSTIETAVAEVLPEEGQLVQVAGFRLAPSEILRLICLGEYQSVYKRGYTAFNGTDPGGTVKKIINAFSLEQRDVCLCIDTFLAHVISDKEACSANYLHSRSLRNLLFSRVEADGITFPSARDLGGVNLAVKPDPSDKLYQNVCCIIVRVGKRRRFGPLEMVFVGVAESLTADRKGFVWVTGAAPNDIVMYNMTKDEYEQNNSISA
jgi:hypothetical protein